jgi:hypothetical protein
MKAGFLLAPDLLAESELQQLAAEALAERPHWERRDRAGWAIVNEKQFVGPAQYWYGVTGDYRPEIGRKLARRLADVAGLDVRPVQSNYLYYGHGDYLGLHHDQHRCPYAVIALLDGDAEPLCLHPELIGARLEDLARFLEPGGHEGGTRVSLAKGPLLVAGTMLPHHREPHALPEMITIVTFCFAPENYA